MSFEVLHAKPCRIIWKLHQQVSFGSLFYVMFFSVFFDLQTLFFDGKTVFFRFLAEIQLGSSIKIISKSNHFPSRSLPKSLLEPCLEASWAPEASKTATRRPKTAQDGPKTAQDGPKTAQDGPRTAQDGPKLGSKNRPLESKIKKMGVEKLFGNMYTF